MCGAIADVRAACRDERQRALVDLVVRVTREPWALSSADRGGLGDDDVLHAIALSAFFGHLNRIADATGVPLDYRVAIEVAPADAAMAPMATASERVRGARAIEMTQRPATLAALTAWRDYVMGKPSPLSREERAAIASWVGDWLGDSDDGDDDAATAPAIAASPRAVALKALAEIATLAPWQLGEAAYAPLRALGFDDPAIFDACATASSCGAFSRIDVALRALLR